MVHGVDRMALFIFTKNILNGDKINLFNYGNHIRDFTYVDDIVEPIKRIIKKFQKKIIKYKKVILLKVLLHSKFIILVTITREN